MRKQGDIILAIGNSGTGKRTVCKTIQNKWELRRFSPDDRRRELGKEDYDPRDTQEVLLSIFTDIRFELEAGNSVLFHSHYKTSFGRELVYNIAQESGSGVLVIECHAPEEVAKQRIQSRSHKDHLHCPPTDTSVYDRIKKIWEPPDEISTPAFGHVSHIQYDSVDKNIKEVLVRDIHRRLVQKLEAILENIQS